MGYGLSRRSFMKTVGTLAFGAGVTIAAPSIMIPSSAVAGGRTERFTLTRPFMGTFVTISVCHESQTLAEEAIGRAFEEMEFRIAVLDRHDSGSALSVLNSQGVLESCPDMLVRVVEKGLALSETTSGAFNPAVGPLVDLSLKGNHSQAELTQAMELSDVSAVKVDSGRIKLDRWGMRLTLDGIAKGYVADMASDVLTRQGALNHIIDAGGDVRASGVKENGKPWKVAVESPFGKTEHVCAVPLVNRAMATSGEYRLPGRSVGAHHIINPATGKGMESLASVTVQADTVMVADALSTALFVTTPSRALSLVDTMSGVEAMLVTRNNTRLTSRGWPA